MSRLLLTLHRKRLPSIAYTDTDGRFWTTFESVGFTETCARCGAEISRGLWRAKSDEYICRDHVQVTGEQGTESGNEEASISMSDKRDEPTGDAAAAQPVSGLEALDELEEQASERIRSVLHDGRLFFSVVDVVALLTGSVSPGAYWRKLKQRLLEDEGAAQTVTNCHALKLPAADGRQRLTDCADQETLLRIVQSIPSPKAEPFKQWLARVGAERLEEIEAPERAADRMRQLYRQRGYTDEWIRARLQSIVTRDELTEEWRERGAHEGREFAVLTEILHSGTFDLSTDEHKGVKALKKRDNLRDNMTPLELALTILSETTATALHQQHDSQGMGELSDDARRAGRVGGTARRDVEAELGRPVVSAENAKSLTARAIQPELLGAPDAPQANDEPAEDGAAEGSDHDGQ